VRWHRDRTLIRLRGRALIYRGRLPMLLLAVAAMAAAIVTGTLFGLTFVAAAGPVAVMLGWLAYAVRLPRFAGGGGRDWPPGMGVREPRRPLPKSPAGAAARPRPLG
jgi:hypothetical protein